MLTTKSQQSYKKKAELYQLDFVNLRPNESDYSLLNKQFIDDYIKYKLVPLRKHRRQVIVAIADLNEDVIKWVQDNFNDYKLVISTPQEILDIINYNFKNEFTHNAVNKLFNEIPKLSAKNSINFKQLLFISILTILTSMALILRPQESIFAILSLLVILYFCTITLKNSLFIAGLSAKIETVPESINLDNLPIYTLLIPLFKEDKVIAKLTSSIQELDYPKSKLDVKLIVEEDDEITINAIEKQNLESYFELIKVPFSDPQTKPKACNYALNFARGEYITIYDAEDLPSSKQLKKVLQAFEKSPKNVKCVQCKLNFFNRDENLLTKLFSLEYAIHFEYLLLGLERFNIPIPLGGTSNHFKTSTLKEMLAWDPYNVTEDADLGIRLYQKHYKCKIINSTTMEECPVSLMAWVSQRSRWIKGHIQTYLVHMREPFKFYKKTGLVGFVGLLLFLAAPCFIFLISPVFLVISILLILDILNLPASMPENFDRLVNISIFMFVYGKISQIMQAITTIVKKKHSSLILTSLAFLFYWVLHSVASYKSLWQLITKPHFWEKTNHGETKLGD